MLERKDVGEKKTLLERKGFPVKEDAPTTEAKADENDVITFLLQGR
ncbi:hypothetical protein QWZ08_07150 [Ferruginibacter paludis]|nr:hypothetical protein [Ferruginibacter paludis]MDN3655394.1 hypothetical protein [Ferruginibacter paludis]